MFLRNIFVAAFLFGCLGGEGEDGPSPTDSGRDELVAPGITLLAPASGSVIEQGEPVRLEVQVTDADTDDLAFLSLSWMGEGTDDAPTSPDSTGRAIAFAEGLTVGPKTLSVEVTDPDGLTATAAASFRIVPGPVDNDGDGFPVEEDCNDDDETIFPGAVEVCDGVDQDCDESIDEGVLLTFYADSDDDGFGDADTPTEACEAPTGFVVDATDCDDTRDVVFPGATEICDGLDQDCDTIVDDGLLVTFFADADGDGFGDPLVTTDACVVPAGFASDDTDCDDSVSTRFPGAPEICDGLDQDCDAVADEGRFCESMLTAEPGWTATPVHTVGDVVAGYQPPGRFDGLAAYALDPNTVRVVAVHQLPPSFGTLFSVQGASGPFSMRGSRMSYVDFDRSTRAVVDARLAIDTVRDAAGNVVADTSFLGFTLAGFTIMGSATLVEPDPFGNGSGPVDRMILTGETTGGSFNPVGGAIWALDPATDTLWAVPAMGRGAWRGITALDPGVADVAAFLLTDDTLPFDADGDGVNEAPPVWLYVGLKSPGNWLARNGLAMGALFVWVEDNQQRNALDFRGTGSTRTGSWVVVDNAPDPSLADEFAVDGYDEYGWPSHWTLRSRARDLGAFGFTPPTGATTNPQDGSQAAFAVLGLDDFPLDPATSEGVDTFGTIYQIDTDFSTFDATIEILYDGDDDPQRRLRAPDHLEWSEDGNIYVHEDEFHDASLSGEFLFGPGATNPTEAGVVALDPATGGLSRVATIDRAKVLDPTTTGIPFDDDAGNPGEWESAGMVDVSTLFGDAPGTLFLSSVQAHGIQDQTDVNADSDINDQTLYEGGQLVLLQRSAP